MARQIILLVVCLSLLALILTARLHGPVKIPDPEPSRHPCAGLFASPTPEQLKPFPAEEKPAPTKRDRFSNDMEDIYLSLHKSKPVCPACKGDLKRDFLRAFYAVCWRDEDSPGWRRCPSRRVVEENYVCGSCGRDVFRWSFVPVEYEGQKPDPMPFVNYWEKNPDPKKCVMVIPEKEALEKDFVPCGETVDDCGLPVREWQTELHHKQRRELLRDTEHGWTRGYVQGASGGFGYRPSSEEIRAQAEWDREHNFPIR